MIPRRAFLKRSALGLAAIQAHYRIRQGATPIDEQTPKRAVPFLARAFALIPVYDFPDGQPRSDGIGIAPDSVHEVTALIGEWARIEYGFVPRTALQPIMPYRHPPIWSHADAPFWAEVITPSVPVCQWCDARAPITYHMGYGGVVNVLGTLIDDYKVVWYEIAAGWIDARHVTPFLIPEPSRSGETAAELLINRADRTIRVIIDGRTALHTAYYGGDHLDGLSESITITPYTAIGRLTIDRPGDHLGRPWLMKLTFDDPRMPDPAIRLSGAWHHNRFGLRSESNRADRTYPSISGFLTESNADLTIAPDMAKTLYTLLRATTHVCVVKVATK